MDYKSFRLSELKASNESPGRFTGFAAMYGNVDRNGEVIDRGAMSRSIKSADGEFPLLWQHKYDSILGVAQLEDTERGAKTVGQINVETGIGVEVYKQMLPPVGFKRGAIRDLSIGYIVHKDEMIGGVRHLKEIQLLEVSLVTVAANPKTFVTSVKERQDLAARISRLETAFKMIPATLIEEGLISDPEKFHSLLGDQLDGPGTDLNDPSIAHSLGCKDFIEEMRLYNFRKELAYERAGGTKEGVGGDQEPPRG